MNTNENKSKSLKLFKEAVKNGARKIKAAHIIGTSIRSLQRWSLSMEDQRQIVLKKPSNKLSSKERDNVIEVSCSDRFKDLTPNNIVPLLATEGRYIASESTFYRILKAESLLNHRTNCQPKKHRKPPQLQADRPNQLWSWDITYIKSSIRGEYFYLYLFMDVWSRAIVGWSIYDQQCDRYAAKLISKTCLEYNVSSINLHSDNGGPMKGATMLATLERLGVIPSFSRPSVSNDNPYSESLFKTIKYNVTYPPNNFKTIEEAESWFTKFVYWYNEIHLHSSLKFVTPMQRHRKEDLAILQKRTQTYIKAKANNPIRWSGNIRKWQPEKIVYLNPEKVIIKAA